MNKPPGGPNIQLTVLNTAGAVWKGVSITLNGQMLSILGEATYHANGSGVFVNGIDLTGILGNEVKRRVGESLMKITIQHNSRGSFDIKN